MARLDVLVSLWRRRIKTDSCRSAWTWQSRSCSRCCWKWRLAGSVGGCALQGDAVGPRGAGVGRACSSAAHSRKDRRHRSCCPSEMGALPECQTSPLPCHPCVSFPPVLSCALCVPSMLQVRVTAAQSSVSNSSLAG